MLAGASVYQQRVVPPSGPCYFLCIQQDVANHEAGILLVVDGVAQLAGIVVLVVGLVGTHEPLRASSEHPIDVTPMLTGSFRGFALSARF
jgi:hypothetical protein